ncbi:MAG TPA: long-chain fatty acid--CoA ligase [Acidimicrobiales bacterium]|nr:long-chain fatty acid--CoA ligase [Acidimicrobiales bacterium]
MTIPGLMQPTPLNICGIFQRMESVYADGEIVSPHIQGGRTTYGALAERVRRLATALVDELGVRPGDRVASFAFNTSRHEELYFAVPMVGAVLHTVNVRLFDDQIAYIVNHADDRVLFVDGELVERLGEVAPKLDCVRQWVRMGDGPDDAPGIEALSDHDALVAASAPLSRLPDVDEAAACGLCYTSGTTGMPKGVLSSHRAMWLHSMATCMVDSIGLSESDRVLPVVPMFHAFGWGLPYSAPFTGAELVLHGSDSSPEALARLIAAEKVTVAAGVPTIWKTLLPLVQSGEADISSLRLIFVGGSASPRALIEAYQEVGVDYLQVWGMTETGPLACASRPRRRHRGAAGADLIDVKERTGTILPGLEARVVADDGVVCAADGETVGELQVRGPWIASAYFQAEDDGRFPDGWLRTGDMASIEPDGVFRIVDRSKDLVKSGGEWISSVELEGHLLAHPDVADAAVVGVRSRKWDERPVAVVVPRNGAAPTLGSVREFLSTLVAKWWLPDELVIVEEIPKTSVGKLDKKVLREQLSEMELP